MALSRWFDESDASAVLSSVLTEVERMRTAATADAYERTR